MNAEQKKIALECIRLWGSEDLSDCAGDQMSALLQELANAPEPKPFGYFKSEPFGWTDCAETDDGAIALYTAQPAPSVLDEQLQEAFDRGLKAGNEQKDLQQAEIHRLHDLLAAALTPAEAPVDVARDAELLDWLEQEAKESRTGVSIVYKNQADDEGGIKRGYRLMRYHQIFSARLNLREAIDAAMSEKGGAK